MRKTVSVLAVVFIVIGSTGVIAQSGGLTWNPDGEVENKTATKDFDYAYSTNGDNPSQPLENPNEYVTGIQIEGGIMYTLSYTKSTDTTFQYEGWAYDISDNYNSIKLHPGVLVTHDSEMLNVPLTLDIINGTSPRTYGDNKNLIFGSTVDGERLVKDGGGTAESYVSEHDGGNTNYHLLTDGSGDNEIVYTNKVTVGGEKMILIQTDARLVKHNVSTHQNTELLHHDIERTYWQTQELTNNSFLSHRHYSSLNVTDDFAYSSMAHYYNLSSGEWSYMWANIVGMNEKYIAISEPKDFQGTNKWNNHTLVFKKKDFAEIMRTTSGEYGYPDLNNHPDLALSIPNPENVSEFDRGFYESGKWIFIDEATKKAYVYPKDLSNLEATVEQPWRSIDGFQAGFKTFVDNGTIHLASFDDNEVEVFDTNVQVNQESGLCSGHLNPPVLENFWETKTVCWIPIFVGVGILNTIYQWLILAILIAMPIASVTDNDIATMATINGVLVIAMILGRMSPGYVAISLLATILLSLYGTRGGDVNVDIGTGEM